MMIPPRTPCRGMKQQGRTPTPFSSRGFGRTPQSQKSQSSLPRRHFLTPSKSTLREYSDDDDESSSSDGDGSDVFSNGSSSISNPSSPGAQHHMLPKRLSTATSSSLNSININSLNGDKENNGTNKKSPSLQYSPTQSSLDGIKSKLARNKLRRESTNESVRSILSSVSRDRSVDRASSLAKYHLKKRDHFNSSNSNEQQQQQENNKRYKIDLAPRIAASRDGGAGSKKIFQRIVRGEQHGRNSIATSGISVTSSLTAPTIAKMAAAAAPADTAKMSTVRRNNSSMRRQQQQQQQQQQRTEKCLWDALEIMQSMSYDTTSTTTTGTGAGTSSIGSSKFGSSNSNVSSSTASSSNARLKAKLKLKRKAGSINDTADACSTTHYCRSNAGKSQTANSQASSTASYASSGISSDWLKRNKIRRSNITSGCSSASSTFSVSPFSKESSLSGRGSATGGGGCVGLLSYAGTSQLDCKENRQVSVDRRQKTLPQLSENVDPNKSTAIVAAAQHQQQHQVAPQSIETVGSYLGTVDGTPAAKLVIGSSRHEVNRSLIQPAASFPPQSIDDKLLCIDQVPSEMTPDNYGEKRDVLTPLPSSKERLCQSPSVPLDFTQNDPNLSMICAQRSSASPAPTSVAAKSCAALSYAQSYATSDATSTTTNASTNLFDMLRTTFNHGSGDNSISDEEVQEEYDTREVEDNSNQEKNRLVLATPQHPPLSFAPLSSSNISKPPLSPIPPMNSTIKQSSNKKVIGQVTELVACGTSVHQASPGFGALTSPQFMSPMILRGTPCKSLCSNATSGYSNMLDSYQGSSVDHESESPANESKCEHLEYSFLAHALVATNILATPASPDGLALVPASTSTPPASGGSTDVNDATIPTDGLRKQQAVVAKTDKKLNKTASKGGKANQLTSVSKKRTSFQELEYASIGASSSSLKPAFRPKPKSVDPMAMTFDDDDATQDSNQVIEAPALSAKKNDRRRSYPATTTIDLTADGQVMTEKTQTPNFCDDLFPWWRERGPTPQTSRKDETTNVERGKAEVEESRGQSPNKGNGRPSVASVHDILSIATALDEDGDLSEDQLSCSHDTSFERCETKPRQESQSQNDLIAMLIDRVNNLEEKLLQTPMENSQQQQLAGSHFSSPSTSSALDAYLGCDLVAATTSSLTSTSPSSILLPIESNREVVRSAPKSIPFSDDNETVKLQERIKWLEKILGFGRGANSIYEDEIADLKERLSILERRLEEEMAMKEQAAMRALALTTDIEAAQTVHRNVEQCLRKKNSHLENELDLMQKEEAAMQKEKVKEDASVEKELLQQIKYLESQLEEVKNTSIENAATAKAETDETLHMKDREMEKLRQTNEDLAKKQHELEKELASCAKDNDGLRVRVLSIADESSTKQTTLSTALSQLKSLSEKYYRVKQSLTREENARKDEVSSLQWSLDDMSRQMLTLTSKVHDLQTENDEQTDELRRARLEKVRSNAFRRAARGA